MIRIGSLLLALAAACGHSAPAPLGPPVPPTPVADPSHLPERLVAYMKAHAWGQMHLEWHSVRRWDMLPPAAVAYAERQGWKRAERQEGDPGNGVEFLAMHRAMLEMLAAQDPAARAYLVGWASPPTDPHDVADPLPGDASTAFDPDMLAALDRLAHHLDSFASEDELGLYIETSFRPVPGHPDTRATDRSAGIHNYLHNRFQDPSSPIDLGNPAVNLLNARFWRLHGWIDHLWTTYRAHAGLRDTDPAYQTTMQTATAGMTMRMKGIGPAEAPPRELIDAVRP